MKFTDTRGVNLFNGTLCDEYCGSIEYIDERDHAGPESTYLLMIDCVQMSKEY